MSLDFNNYNYLAYNLMTMNGSSTNRGAQAFAFDERNRNMYVFEGGAVNRFPLDGNPEVSAIDQTLVNGTALGHQGLAVEYNGDDMRLWCTSSVGGRYAVRFKYVKDVAVDSGEVFQLFKNGIYANNTSCTPTVSRDQRYLIAHGTKLAGTVSTIRVFDLKALITGGPGDYTDKYLYEWETDNIIDASNPMQGTASCGDYVYLIAGGTGFTTDVNKRLHVYTIEGKLVEKNDNVTVGRDDAMATPDGTRYEPEGLSMMIDPVGNLALYSGYLSGNPGQRRFRIYHLAAYPPITKGLAFNKFNTEAYELLDANGSTTIRAAQSFAFDERRNLLYTSFESAINRYELSQGNKLKALDSSLPNSPAVGHQGLAIEYLTTGIKLWATSNVDRRAVTRFDYQKDVAISGGEEYRLFPNTTFKNSIQTTPCISFDNKYLIAQGQRTNDLTTTIRVFELSKLINGGPGDYTQAWLYEFDMPGLVDASNPVQGLASCGSYVYAVAGGTGIDPSVNKRLHVYTIKGKFVEADNNVLVGIHKAREVPNYRAFEPEGLTIRVGQDGRPYLYLGIMYAYPDRRYIIYRLNAYNQVNEKDLGMGAYIKDFNDRVVDIVGLPDNTMHEVLLVDSNGKFGTRPSCIRASIVENDVELDLMKGAKEDFGKIFNYWKRISRSGTNWSDEANPDELTGWAYNASTDQLSCTINSGSLIGFMSPDQFDDYVFDVQVSSDNNDDDFIGLCIAYAVDPTDGKTHILTAMRAMNGRAPLTIDKDYNGFNRADYNVALVFDGLTWADGVVADATNGTNSGHGGWLQAGIGSRLRVTRTGDIIKVETSQPNSTEIYEPATRTINLADDPKLTMFRGAQSFGYVACSQPNATWAVTSRPSINRPIIDVRTWTKYNKLGNDWSPTQSSKNAVLADGILHPNWSHTNETLGKFYFMDQQTNLYRM